MIHAISTTGKATIRANTISNKKPLDEVAQRERAKRAQAVQAQGRHWAHEDDDEQAIQAMDRGACRVGGRLVWRGERSACTVVGDPTGRSGLFHRDARLADHWRAGTVSGGLGIWSGR